MPPASSLPNSLSRHDSVGYGGSHEGVGGEAGAWPQRQWRRGNLFFLMALPPRPPRRRQEEQGRRVGSRCRSCAPPHVTTLAFPSPTCTRRRLRQPHHARRGNLATGFGAGGFLTAALSRVGCPPTRRERRLHPRGGRRLRDDGQEVESAAGELRGARTCCPTWRRCRGLGGDAEDEVELSWNDAERRVHRQIEAHLQVFTGVEL
jgi:hypothetical protein